MTQCQIDGDCPTIVALRSGDVVAAEGVFEFYEVGKMDRTQPSKEVLKAIAVIASAVPFDPKLTEEQRGIVADHLLGVMDAIESFHVSEVPAAGWEILAEVERVPKESECDCLVPAMDGAGQHSPSCAIFKTSPTEKRKCVPPGYCHCTCHETSQVTGEANGCGCCSYNV